ncbi:PREDICTED: nose resistant to fluoxetine protein 6 isoform X1 [Papilio xuthus]|uniref:Nose resistant to fluoxetine protein 6 isoform X1 n=1 Tax=Papilio xuthus TaxID=66420 RepID=A0AAJ6YZ06_PAPXU|nr:PREDICTED: nose resistant to fluoxetine protein 6 isoform X1 [Papilio xuthus]
MAARACLLLLFAGACAARECIELTLSERSLTDSLLNGTILKLTAKNESNIDSARTNVLELWDRFPRILVPMNGTTEQCRRESRVFRDSLDRLELWALKMFDATAKPPSGILSGNGNQYGDFDECLDIDGAVRGKYCLASLQVTIKGDEKMEHLDTLIHSGHYLRSNVTDMGHRVPRYSSILWGVCMPSSCSSYDLEEELSQKLSGLDISVRVYNTMCTVKNVHRPYSFGKTLSITFFLAIILLLSMGTILDDGKEGATNFEKLLNAFSLKRNLRKVFDLSEAGSRVKGVDAFRGLNAFALLIAHKSMAMAHSPFVNKTHFSAVFGMPWAVIGRSAIVYTDSFLYLSGFLNAHNLFQELERKGTIDMKGRLLSRWFRLFPLFLSLMLFCTYILPDVNNGPQWNLVVEEHSRVCEKNMWKSFLFIHNYFGFEEMCLTHTHQIGMDMQLYVATLPLMLVLWRFKRLGWVLLVGIAAASTALRYLAIHWYDISMFVYYGISVQKLLDAARYSYILPTHRATIYLIGVVMAYVMRSKKFNFNLTDTQVRLLWAATFGVAAFTIVSPYRMGLEGYQYEHFPAAVFAALSPILWGLFMCLSHWAICNDYTGVGTAFVESRAFKFFNKIAYAVYLTQFPIFFYNVGVQRHAEFYTPLLLMHVPEMLAILMVSILATVTIEMPFNQVYRIYFGKSQTKLKDK